MRIAIVHGQKPPRGRSIHPIFKKSLEIAARLANEGRIDLILISGGVTRPGTTSEARQGEKYLEGQTSIPILLEENSKSLRENVFCLRIAVGDRYVEKRYVIARATCIETTRLPFLYNYFWPLPAIETEFIRTPDNANFTVRNYEWLLSLFARIDPPERFILAIPKIILRNA